MQMSARQLPDLDEAAVEAAYAARKVGHEDAVGGGFERGAQFGQQAFALGFGTAAAGLVMQQHQPKAPPSGKATGLTLRLTQSGRPSAWCSTVSERRRASGSCAALCQKTSSSGVVHRGLRRNPTT